MNTSATASWSSRFQRAVAVAALIASASAIGCIQRSEIVIANPTTSGSAGGEQRMVRERVAREGVASPIDTETPATKDAEAILRAQRVAPGPQSLVRYDAVGSSDAWMQSEVPVASPTMVAGPPVASAPTQVRVVVMPTPIPAGTSAATPVPVPLVVQIVIPMPIILLIDAPTRGRRSWGG